MGDLGNKHPAPPPVRGFPVVREWKPKVDPKTGRNFYFNPLTKASAWTLPELEQPKVHCFKCFKELDSAAAQCCAPEPEPSGDDSSRGRSSTKTAPTKPAPRRNTGAGIATFVQPASPPPPDESCIPPSPSESITSSPTPLPSESSSPSTNSIPTNNPSLSESSIPSTRSSLTDSSSPPTDSSSPSVSPTISVEASSPDSEYKAGEREQVADSGLPLGWIAILDKSVGSLYYFHSETQEVTWTRPESQRAVVEADLPYGWVAIKDSSSQSVYYFNQHTQEVTWEKPDMPLPLQDDPVPESASDRPKIRPGALLAAKNALLETKSRDSYNLQGLSEADTTFLNDVLRPKYGDGQLLKDPSLVDSLFALMTTRESLRKVIFCEFFLSCFRQDVILQAMLRRASWKCWLVSLISEAGVGTEMVDYVLMTLIEMFSYFFHRFSENENTILGTDIVLGIGVSFGKHITMYDFVMDAAFVLVRASSKEVCLRMFSGTFSKIASWGPLKPPWAVPNFLMPQWQNLFSSIEAVEECIFFTIPSKEFCLPERPVFPGMSAVDAIIALLERLKVKEFDQIVETDPAILKLQKAYSVLLAFSWWCG